MCEKSGLRFQYFTLTPQMIHDYMTTCSATSPVSLIEALSSAKWSSHNILVAYNVFCSCSGWVQRRLPSMDNDDFETIPSSAEESSNSSEDEGNHKNVGHNPYKVGPENSRPCILKFSLETEEKNEFVRIKLGLKDKTTEHCQTQTDSCKKMWLDQLPLGF